MDYTYTISGAKKFSIAVLGIVVCILSVRSWYQEHSKIITSVTVSGELRDVHTVHDQPGDTLHFTVVKTDGERPQPLYTADLPMTSKAQDGENVSATFTQESGYVSRFRIVSGPSAGYAFDEPDRPHTFKAIAGFLVGFCFWGGYLPGLFSYWKTRKTMRDE